MNGRRRYIIGLILLLVIGLGVAVFEYVKGQGGMDFVSFRIQRWVRTELGKNIKPTPSEIRNAKLATDLARERVFKLYPELKIEPKSVPPAQNGFLAILLILEDPELLDLIRSGAVKNVDQPVIDAEIIKKELEKYQVIGAEIERIADIPERSSENLTIDFQGFFGAREILTMSQYLMLKARLAAMRKDETEAVKYATRTKNLAEHLHQIESSNLLIETSYILMSLDIRRQVMLLLSDLGQSADIEKWRELLKPREQIASRFSFLQKGEFNYFLKQWSYMVFVRHSPDAIPDPEALVMAYAACVDANMKHYSDMSLSEFRDSSPLQNSFFEKKLSKESLALFSVMNAGASTWQAGMIRAYVSEMHFDAALDLLILENAGEDLSKRTETHVLNPLTEKPFVYDPVKRVLPEVPESDGGRIEELKLPW